MLTLSRSYLSSACLSPSPLLQSLLPQLLFLLLCFKFTSSTAVTALLNQIRFTSLPTTLHYLPLQGNKTQTVPLPGQPLPVPELTSNSPLSPFPAVLWPTSVFPLFLMAHWDVPVFFFSLSHQVLLIIQSSVQVLPH